MPFFPGELESATVFTGVALRGGAQDFVELSLADNNCTLYNIYENGRLHEKGCADSDAAGVVGGPPGSLSNISTDTETVVKSWQVTGMSRGLREVYG